MQHLRRKDDAGVSALEIVFAAQISVFVKDHLIHIELIQSGIQ
jgi:hypothetical protein